MRTRTTSLLVSLLTLAGAPLAAQKLPASPSSGPPVGPPVGGNEFWVVFQKNFRDHILDDRTQAQKPADKLSLTLVITGNADTRGVVEIEGLKFRQEFTLAAGAIARVAIDSAAQVRSSEIPEKLAVHVTADHPVLVYGVNSRFQTTDSYIGFPVQALGTSYRAAGYSPLQSDLVSQLAVIATENGSTVRITPTAATAKGKPAGVPFEVTLGRGDVYQVIAGYNPKAKSDLTGTLIESDKPVAVFSGHNCAYVPDPRVKACNILCEQLPPIKSWGERFVVGGLGSRRSSVARVIAAESGTHVFLDETEVAVLGAGEFFENRDITAPCAIRADKPVMVVQYAKGFDDGDDLGDPMMIVLPPVERYLASHTMVTAITGSWHHFVNISAPTSAIAAVEIDGKAVPASSFRPVGRGEYSVASVEVAYGSHRITGPAPVGIYTYGIGFEENGYDAYGSGGLYLIDSAVK